MKIIKASVKNLKIAVNVIKKGGLIIFPTDTVYGLMADARNEKALELIFKIKKRPLRKPLAVFVKNIQSAEKLAVIGEKQKKILKKLWPGKITCILTARKRLPKRIVGDGKVGLRMTKYKLLKNLLQKLDCPLAQTSANISGEKETVQIKQVLKYFLNQKKQPDLIFDAGNLKPSLPSTVIDLATFKIKRKGEVGEKEIYNMLKI